jgi:hypothetical protein
MRLTFGIPLFALVIGCQTLRAPGALAEAERDEAVKCYELTVGPWRPPRSGKYTPPRLIRLDTASAFADRPSSWGHRKLEPDLGLGFNMWETLPDGALHLVWSNGIHATVVIVQQRGDSLAGEALETVHSQSEAVARATITGWRVRCSRLE